MRPYPLLLLLALLGLSASPASTQPLSPRRIALTDVTVIDGTGAAPRRGMTILVEDGRIAEVFPNGARAVPADAARPDVAGSYVIPGLIDSHVHLATFERPDNILRAILRFSLLGGVTTVRDMGGYAERVLSFARSADSSSALSPRIYSSAVFAGAEWFANYDSTRVAYWSGGAPKGQAVGARRIDDSTDIAAAVRAAKTLGVRGIKLYAGLTATQMERIGREAKAQGLAVWAHAVAQPALPLEVLAARPTSTSHADMLIWTAVRPGALGVGTRAERARLIASVQPDARVMQALYARMVRERVLLEPTLIVMQLGDVQNGRFGPLGEVQAWSVAATRAAHRAGVGIVAGTDAIGQQTPNIHTEMQVLVSQVGLTPLQAIQAATQHGAQALGLADSTGTITVGKWADLVVLRADPSTDIRNTQTVRSVMRRGVLHERSTPWQLSPGAEPPPTP
ncbi:MAG: amidohydrolase family protein [Gemmatimonadaceae bacterium]